ncbi:MAG: DUF192 domain-containing protein [Aminipila sp.]
MKQKQCKVTYLNHQGAEKNITICLHIANNPLSRLKGLIGNASLPSNEALLLSPCAAIHTFFMKYNIDVLFLDKNYNCIKMVKNVKPWTFSVSQIGAKHTMEIMASTILSDAEHILSIKIGKSDS